LVEFQKKEKAKMSSIECEPESFAEFSRACYQMRYQVSTSWSWSVAASRIKKEMWKLLGGSKGLIGGGMSEYIKMVQRLFGPDLEVFVSLVLEVPGSDIKTLLESSPRISIKVVVGVAQYDPSSTTLSNIQALAHGIYILI
jgi:hypothetical protein